MQNLATSYFFLFWDRSTRGHTKCDACQMSSWNRSTRSYSPNDRTTGVNVEDLLWRG